MSERRAVLEFFENPQNNWKEKAEENIRRFRKGRACIKITDKGGKPVSNAKLDISQIKHGFKFGANCFMLDELETEEKNSTYKTKFAQLFNMATLPFYWCDTEPQEGKTRYTVNSEKIYRRPPIDLCLQYCRENGIEPREHALAYEHFFPDWLKGLSVAQVKEKTEYRFKEIARLYSDKIPTVEVTNEMFWAEGVTPFYKESDYIEWCFKTARKYFPNNQLVINEWNSSWIDKAYYGYISESITKGAPIDAIGLQYHMFHSKESEYEATRKYYDPDHLVQQMDMYSEFNKPLQITEITVPAYSYLEEDEDIQAKLLEYLYTLWFSHPSIEQIIYWNLVDGYAAFTEPGNMTGGENVYYGGLLRFDMSEKPAYRVLDTLINKKWHTAETVSTDSEGLASFDGFYGDYEITVSTDGLSLKKVIQLSAKGPGEFTLVI